MSKDKDQTIEDLREALQRISDWANDAYALEFFEDVSSLEKQRAHVVLADESGISLSSLYAAFGRHLMSGIGKIARDALNEKEQS